MDNYTILRDLSGEVMSKTREVNAALQDAPEPYERRSSDEIRTLLQEASRFLDNAFQVYGQWEEGKKGSNT